MERSLLARSAKSVFFEEFNDIDIFIEDTAVGYEKLFMELFSRVFAGSYRVSNVFPLGSRGAVIAECDQNLPNIKRPTLYVVDGDLHLINQNTENRVGLYTLPYYCVENLLIDENAIHNLINEESAVISREHLIEEFDYQGWVRNNSEILTDLFIEYGVAFSTCPSIQTVAFDISNLVSSNTGDVDRNKVATRKSAVTNAVIEEIGADEYRRHRSRIEAFALNSEDAFLKFVSAKDYILPLLLMRIRRITSTKAPNVNIKLRLAMICNLTGIADSIQYVANS
jgi:hypothetical protein